MPWPLRLLMRPRVRSFLTWTVALIAAGLSLYFAWHDYDRPDHKGTVGHTYVDFAGQWLMGRMLVRGEGPYLYDRERVHQALRDAYGPEDGDRITGLLPVAHDRAGVAGPLYPPVQAFLFYPLGLLPPLPAYRIAQIGNILLTFAIGFLVRILTRGRIWGSVATILLMCFPGWNGAICLAQNSLVSLALLVLGWLLLSRGRPWLGGATWGLLAFKPVWAAAFFLVPLLARRGRFAAAMLLTGLALVLLTLPFVSVTTWFNWLAVGREASAGYAVYENWIFLSRDLQGVPRRWMLTFADAVATDTDRPLPNFVALSLWLGAIALTGDVALERWRRPAGLDGVPAAFLMLGAWLGCYHFMYYDVVLAALPVCLLFMEPLERRPLPWLRYVVPAVLTILLYALPHIADGIDYARTGGHPAFRSPPFDTLCLLALWAWCGWRWLRGDQAEPAQPATLSSSARAPTNLDQSRSTTSA